MCLYHLKMITLVFLIVRGSLAADVNNNIKELVQGVLHDLCPGANVCLANKTIFGNQETKFTPGKRSCCTECSCDSDCESEGNCCFQHDDLRTENVGPEMSACIFPTLPQPLSRDRIFHQSYRMISDVPKYDKTGKTIIDAKCGSKQVSPWGGALFPVSSRKTKVIYKNSACANAANVTDGEPWEVLMSCSLTFNVGAAVPSYITGIYSGRIPKQCRIQFMYPGNYSDLVSQTCYEDLKSSCERDFKIPEELPWSRKQIEQACRSDLISPYRRYDMFANVFCLICKGLYFSKTLTCNDVNPMVKLRGTGHGFVSLIDLSAKSRINPTPKKQLYVPIACPVIQDGEEPDLCRTIYCPSGQIRDEEGNCVFAIKELVMQKCAVHIKLKADMSFSIDETFEFFAGVEERNVSPLIHRWPRDWFIRSVSHKLANGNENMTNIVYVEMMKKATSSDLNVLLTNIKKMLKLSWELKLRNETSISMSAYLTYIPTQFHIGYFGRITTKNQEEANTTIPLYVYIYRMKQHVFFSSFLITKLYFCNQIELDASEYELHEDNSLLLNKFTNIIIFRGEFSSTFSEKEKLRARICLPNSGFIQSKQDSLSSSVTRNDVSKLLACMCFVIMFMLSFLES